MNWSIHSFLVAHSAYLFITKWTLTLQLKYITFLMVLCSINICIFNMFALLGFTLVDTSNDKTQMLLYKFYLYVITSAFLVFSAKDWQLFHSNECWKKYELRIYIWLNKQSDRNQPVQWSNPGPLGNSSCPSPSVLFRPALLLLFKIAYLTLTLKWSKLYISP